MKPDLVLINPEQQNDIVNHMTLTQSELTEEPAKRRLRPKQRTTLAAFLLVVSAISLVVIALNNRHDHSSHDHAINIATTNTMAEVASNHDHSSHDHTTLANQFVGTEQISPPAACRTIIGCDDAGPKPQSPGDRGGWAQLMTLLMLAVAVTFITVKIFATKFFATRLRLRQNSNLT